MNNPGLLVRQDFQPAGHRFAGYIQLFQIAWKGTDIDYQIMDLRFSELIIS